MPLYVSYVITYNVTFYLLCTNFTLFNSSFFVLNKELSDWLTEHSIRNKWERHPAFWTLSTARGGLVLGRPVRSLRDFVAVIIYSSVLRRSGDLCGPSCCAIFTARITEKATTPNRCTNMITVLNMSLYRAQQQFIAQHSVQTVPLSTSHC